MARNPKAQRKHLSGNALRGCDLKGAGAMLALGLTYASAGYKGEFIVDAEFVKALLKEYTDVALPKHNLV